MSDTLFDKIVQVERRFDAWFDRVTDRVAVVLFRALFVLALVSALLSGVSWAGYWVGSVLLTMFQVMPGIASLIGTG